MGRRGMVLQGKSSQLHQHARVSAKRQIDERLQRTPEHHGISGTTQQDGQRSQGTKLGKPRLASLCARIAVQHAHDLHHALRGHRHIEPQIDARTGTDVRRVRGRDRCNPVAPHTASHVAKGAGGDGGGHLGLRETVGDELGEQSQQRDSRGVSVAGSAAPTAESGGPLRCHGACARSGSNTRRGPQRFQGRQAKAPIALRATAAAIAGAAGRVSAGVGRQSRMRTCKPTGSQVLV
mmetsp:Transcript_81184/g.263117  ORF Transcript_81184/g.263117 Transcript_81184/m.263117 type:complete len:236 (-) Transcript_81184:758-1465(-)